MTRATALGLMILAGLAAGCGKTDDPQPRLTQQAHPDRKFEVKSMRASQGGIKPGKRATPAP